MSKGDYRESVETVSRLIRQELETTSAIAMGASKSFLESCILCASDSVGGKLEGPALDIVMDHFSTLTSPNIRNQVNALRMGSGSRGYMDNIMDLKKKSMYDYIQDNVFPGQGARKVFMFKMSTKGEGSGVSLVKRMQKGGDLGNCFLMFDHVKRVKDWTTMACHVYDPVYQRVMTIAVCDMQSKDTESQQLMWEALIHVMASNGLPSPNFVGFMADSAQANFNADRIVFGTEDPKVPMPGRERTCLFQWTQSLDRHTKADIKPDMQSMHRQLCKQYKDAKTMGEANTLFQTIRAWWYSSGAASEDSMRALEDWFAFWHFRYRQWGAAMTTVSGLHSSSFRCFGYVF